MFEHCFPNKIHDEQSLIDLLIPKNCWQQLLYQLKSHLRKIKLNEQFIIIMTVHLNSTFYPPTKKILKPKISGEIVEDCLTFQVYHQRISSLYLHSYPNYIYLFSFLDKFCNLKVHSLSTSTNLWIFTLVELRVPCFRHSINL